jgi:hypothetical protein
MVHAAGAGPSREWPSRHGKERVAGTCAVRRSALGQCFRRGAADEIRSAGARIAQSTDGDWGRGALPSGPTREGGD